MRIILFGLFISISTFCKAYSTIGHILYFNSGKSEISINDRQWLDSVSVILRSAATYSINIQGYCDSDGSEESNMILARSRSMNVLDVFIDNKLNNAFITAKSFGENEPVSDNKTEQGKTKNRRVELTITYQLSEKIVTEENHNNKQTGNVFSQKEILYPAGNLSSEKLEVGKTLVLKNLNFEGGTPVLLPESEPTLKELLKIMKGNPGMEIEIGGHVCCGADMQLSLLRAKKVYNYLIGYGIDPKRMTYKGYSFDKPIADEYTEEGRRANRRVEITILKL
jgi:outer membrane protein OmpA-like peptidoglycan-associated protein